MLKILIQALCQFLRSLQCLHCLNILSPGDQYLCLSCRYEIEQYPMGFWTPVNRILYFNRACQGIHICYRYKDSHPIQSLVKHWKYRNKERLGLYLFKIYQGFCPEFLARTFENTIISIIPLHARKLRSRTFNQCYLPAKQFAERLRLTFVSDLLLKNKPGKSSAQLGKSERNRKDKHFILNPTYKPILKTWNRIIIFDDLITTGSTLIQARTCLEAYGQKNIFFLVMASSID
jgi:predicted amidophosphoribosyltransferase